MGREMRRSQERAERRQKQREAQQPRRASMSGRHGVAGAERVLAAPLVRGHRRRAEESHVAIAGRGQPTTVVGDPAPRLVMGGHLLFGWVVEQTLLR
jgi:hypothetical protein